VSRQNLSEGPSKARLCAQSAGFMPPEFRGRSGTGCETSRAGGNATSAIAGSFVDVRDLFSSAELTANNHEPGNSFSRRFSIASFGLFAPPFSQSSAERATKVWVTLGLFTSTERRATAPASSRARGTASAPAQRPRRAFRRRLRRRAERHRNPGKRQCMSSWFPQTERSIFAFSFAFEL
jgi:hypothetical protein